MTSRDIYWPDISVALLPTALYATLGALGLAVGSAGAAVNLALAASGLPRPMRMGLALIVTFGAVLLWSWLVTNVP